MISPCGSISRGSSGQNRIPRVVFMLEDGSKSIWNQNLIKIDFFMKVCSHMAILRRTFSYARILPNMRLASSCSIFIVVLISEIDNVFEWSDSENSSNYHPNLDDYVQKPTCVDESRLVEKPPYLTPYYSSSLHILKIYALRVIRSRVSSSAPTDSLPG